MGSAPDSVIWEYAKTYEFTFVTKDKDFSSLSIAWGTPPKVILLQTGNCSTIEIEQIIRKNTIRLPEFEKDQQGLLILK